MCNESFTTTLLRNTQQQTSVQNPAHQLLGTKHVSDHWVVGQLILG